MKIRLPRPCRRRAGLTLVEGIVVLAILAIVGALYLSTLSRGYTRSSRVGCVTNLKHVVLGFRMWSNDHADEFPFVSTAPESSRPFAGTPQVFRHFQAASNELVRPKILHCHTDKTRTTATNFHQLQNTNLSYFVGLDAREDAPQSILSGDRNLTGGMCSGGFLRTLTPRTEAGWTAEMHQFAGNVGWRMGASRSSTRTACGNIWPG